MKNILSTQSSRDFEFSRQTPARLNDELRVKLLTGIVHFSFTKKDGSLREAYGTLQQDRIEIPAGESAAPNPAVATYFDLEVKAWRSYTIANLIAIY